jgi:hypothetical protein
MPFFDFRTLTYPINPTNAEINTLVNQICNGSNYWGASNAPGQRDEDYYLSISKAIILSQCASETSTPLDITTQVNTSVASWYSLLPVD